VTYDYVNFDVSDVLIMTFVWLCYES